MKELNISKIEPYLAWLFVFCYFLELLSFPDTWVLIGGSAICAVLYARQKILRVDMLICLLTLTVVLYFGLDKNWGIAMITPITYVFPITFLLAHYLAAEVKMNGGGNEGIIKVLLAMILGLTIHGILNSYMWLDGQWRDGSFRIWKDFWCDDYKYAAWQNSYYLPAMAMFLPALMYKKNRSVIINIFIMLSAVFFLYISVVSESRVTALMFPILICMQIVLYMLLERKQFAEKLNMKHVAIAGCVVCVVLILAGIIFVNSSMGQRFLNIMSRDGGIFNNIRFKFQRQALGELFVYPFGGRKMEFMGYGHAHNAWIDIADAAGVIPFFAFVIYTFISVFELVKLLRASYVSTELKLIVFGIYIAFVMFFTIESALESYGRYIAPWIFLQGLIHGYISREKTLVG